MKINSKSRFFLLVISMTLFLGSCSKDPILIPVPMTLEFEQNLSSYNIYAGDAKDLIPSSDFHTFELSSPLFSNYARKQRLVKLPVGQQMMQNGNGVPVFPEGTILVKTFYYLNDETNEELGRQIIETRLLIKGTGQWNVASYIWNNAQTDATLAIDGLDRQVNWTNSSGVNQTIPYRVPDQEECVTCHQVNSKVEPIGPALRNLNIDVTRDGASINQLTHLQNIGVLSSVDAATISQVPDYKNTDNTLAARGKAYLDINCATCHNPNGWTKSLKKDYDFRFETPLEDMGILDRKDNVIKAMENGRMPYIGTTIIDQEGLDLIVQYINSL